MSDIATKLTPPSLGRPTFDYDVPDSERQLETDPKHFAITLTTLGQELDANIVGGLTMKMTYELLQRAVVELDHKPVDQGLSWLDNISPKVRTLMVGALNDMTIPSDAGRATFLASRKVRV